MFLAKLERDVLNNFRKIIYYSAMLAAGLKNNTSAEKKNRMDDMGATVLCVLKHSDV